MVKIAYARKVPGAKIMAETPEGKCFILKHRFPYRDCPQLMNTLRKIREAGEINPALWRPARKGEY